MVIEKKRKKAEVNIVPMVDVLTALIFFFLLTMQFKDVYSVDITPPTMQTAEAGNTQKPTTVAVSKDGLFFFNDEQVSFPVLKEKINDFARGNPEAALVLFADENTPLRNVTDVVDTVKLAKIKKLSLQTNSAAK